jgi:hypothetical protein
MSFDQQYLYSSGRTITGASVDELYLKNEEEEAESRDESMKKTQTSLN